MTEKLRSFLVTHTRMNYTCEHLIHLIETNDTTEALAIIASGQCDYNDTGIYEGTPLIYACHHHRTEVALALIATGQSNPGYVTLDGNTALIHACSNKNSVVALALIATNQSNPNHTDKISVNAFTIAFNNSMYQIVYILLTNDIENSEINCHNPNFVNYISKFYISMTTNVNQYKQDLLAILDESE